MSQLTLQVNNNLQVCILPNAEHQFLMPTKDVANGYGVNISSIRSTLFEHKDELIENKHFIKAGVGISNVKHNSNLWTKRGIVRLGFFIKSDRARQFRDWAEDLIIYAQETNLPARIAELEARLQSLTIQALNVPSLKQIAESRTEYYRRWLRPGNMEQIAKDNDLNYGHVRSVKCGIKSSPRVEALLYNKCIDNQTELITTYNKFTAYENNN